MRELSLQETKEIEFEILKELRDFCKKNDIRFFLSHGSLLGAIRYKGFIPWDDDIDVFIPREDYKKLIDLYSDNDRFHLFAYEKDAHYLFPYAKLCDMTTRKDESIHDNGVTLGLDVDIFPLDTWDDDLERAKREVKYQKKNNFLLGLSKLRKPDSKNPLKRFLKGVTIFFVKIIGSQYYLKRIISEAEKHSSENSKYCGNKAWCVYGERDIIPAEAFASSIEVEFEGEMFPAPIGYDAFLSSLYGDYLPEPPVEKRKTHHSFKAYRL